MYSITCILLNIKKLPGVKFEETKSTKTSTSFILIKDSMIFILVLLLNNIFTPFRKIPFGLAIFADSKKMIKNKGYAK